MLKGLGAVKVNERLVGSEKVAKRSFKLWGALLRFLGKPGSPLARSRSCFLRDLPGHLDPDCCAVARYRKKTTDSVDAGKGGPAESLFR